MMNRFRPAGRLIRRKRPAFFILMACSLLNPFTALAHPMPNSVVLMDIKSKGVAVELQLPLSELQLAFGNEVAFLSGHLAEQSGDTLKKYLISHIRPVSREGRPWTVAVSDLKIGKAQQTNTGPYQELIVHLWLEAPEGGTTRNFILNYDVIVHQVVTHKTLVSVRQDWEAGIGAGHPVEVGVIEWDTRNNRMQPFAVTLAEGSKWRGFKSMVALGIEHIKEGTDHLMFLLVLLLPAPLLAQRKRWRPFGGIKYSIVRLLKIVTAFTIGHSITLLAGSLGWLRLPSQPVELLIAFSIFISAIHALRPLFPGREVYAAGGFGLVHGLAFATTLANLQLDPGPMALSILGFNIGIELMQLFVIAVTVPWLLILGTAPVYKTIRTGGALFAALAAVAWMVQRYAGSNNFLVAAVESIARYAVWMAVGLALAALYHLIYKSKRAREAADNKSPSTGEIHKNFSGL